MYTGDVAAYDLKEVTEMMEHVGFHIQSAQWIGQMIFTIVAQKAD